jgi:hypothetical protein
MERREHAKSFFRLGALAMNGLFHPWNPEIRGSIPLVEALPRCEIRGPSSGPVPVVLAPHTARPTLIS